MTVGKQEFGTRIRELRKRRGMTQVELAERIRRTQPDISALERGHMAPTIPTIKKLAWALGVRPVALLEDILA